MSRRPGYILGDHWLEVAFDRICAGDREEAVLEDYGWVKKGKEAGDILCGHAADEIERLRLTDEERVAVEWFACMGLEKPHNGPVTRQYSATLRGLLDRLGSE